VTLLRRVLGAPKSTSKEILYMELGLMPLRDMIRQRRLTFLHYLLNQDADSLLFKVLEKQCEMKSSKDLVTSVIEDLEVLELHVTFIDIQEMGKTKWKSIVKNVTKENTLKRLEVIKQKQK
jgi:hypothetical protein